ncbi:MAG TPA: D-aminoacyl-tRNA deacylase [Candidatus Nitrosotalea sp.]|nr:D-aminoacyl-tRNA deacylase [Candidatus Nitrosotalea sp.]
MRAVLQRVSMAEVSWEESGMRRGERIGRGLVLLLGVGARDGDRQARQLAARVGVMRVFNGPRGVPDLALGDIQAEALVVPQFTLFADLSRGRRPSFLGAASSSMARELFDSFCDYLGAHAPIRRGRFGADMRLQLSNEGPFTLCLDTDVWEEGG